jgi:hypothetical protein
MQPVTTIDANVASPRKAPTPDFQRRLIWVSVLCLALVISRWALAPDYLITFDEINFALAIEEFNPAKHQPQPPGYPVFVALLKLVASVVGKIEHVFLVVALILSAASLGLLWRLCELMLGRKYGVLGPLLLLFNPPFWLAALTNPVRMCFAAGATAVALCVWLACRRPSALWLPLAAAALGFSAGARPMLAILLAPLLLWGAFQVRMCWKSAGFSALCFCMAVCTWLPSLLLAVGGWRPYLVILRSYAGAQFSGTSLLFGAKLSDAMEMVCQAVVWSCLGAVSWLWAVPFVASKLRNDTDRFSVQFLVMWFLPGLLIHSLFHVADPDHMLSIVPATCVAGALVLMTLTREASQRRRTLTVLLCIVLNIVLFVKPISKMAKPSTYKTVQGMNSYISDVINSVGGVQAGSQVTAVFHESSTGWRHLSYYHPDAHVILVSTATVARPFTTRHILGRQATTRSEESGTVALPSCGTIIWVDPQFPPVPIPPIAMRALHSRIFSTQAVPAESYQFRGIRFRSAEQPCGYATR